MTLRSFFVASDGRLQPPWRLLLFCALTIVCAVVVFVGLGGVLAWLDRAAGVTGAGAALGFTIALLLAHGLMFRAFDRRPVEFVGLHRSAARPGVLGFGFALGAAPIAAASGLLLLAGFLDLVDAPDGSWWLATARITVLLAPAALYEELFARGYLFATLRDWLGPKPAVALTSIGFGVLHVPNPGSNPLPIVVVTLAGVYLASVLLATGSLYAAWMAHLAWNWVMAAALHVSVSGLPLARPDYQVVDDGPDWLTGGTWGPEGGVAAAGGMLAALAYLYWRHSRRNHEPR